MYLFKKKHLLNSRTIFILIASTIWLIAYNGIEFVFPSYLESIGKPYFVIGFLISLIAIGGVIIDLPLGKITSKSSKKKLMVIGIIISMLAVVIVFLFTKNLILALIFLLLGMGYQTWVVPRDSYFASLTSPENRSSMYGLNAETQYIGQSLGPILCGFVLLFFGYQNTYLFYVLLVLLVILIVQIGLKKERHKELTRDTVLSSIKPRNYFSGFKELKKYGVYGFCLLLISFVIMLWEAVLWALQPLFYGKDVLNIPPHLGGFLLACFSIPGIILAYPAGLIADKFGRKKILILSLLLMSFGIAFFSYTQNIYLIFAFAIIISIGWVFSLPAIDGLIVNAFKIGESSPIVGIWCFFVDMGFVVGPLYAGLMSQLFGIRNAFLSVSVIIFISAILIIFLKPKRNLIQRLLNKND